MTTMRCAWSAHRHGRALQTGNEGCFVETARPCVPSPCHPGLPFFQTLAPRVAGLGATGTSEVEFGVSKAEKANGQRARRPAPAQAALCAPPHLPSERDEV